MADGSIDNTAYGMDRGAALKEYYSRYLQTVRGLTMSSVRHYLDALNNISRRLVSRQLVRNDIYEIMDLDQLESVRNVLYADPEFVEQNERGRRMYSAAMNNYIRFASGEDFTAMFGKMGQMDTPLKPEPPTTVERSEWKRSNILRIQTLISADYKCEIDTRHDTFIAEKSRKPYMESHHAIPLSQQPHFENSLDAYANLVCLCPICHRKIHYGIQTERETLIKHLYHNRAERLANSGIRLSQLEFIQLSDLAKDA